MLEARVGEGGIDNTTLATMIAQTATMLHLTGEGNRARVFEAQTLAAELEPTCLEALVHLARHYVLTEPDREKAWAIVERGAALDPGNGILHIFKRRLQDAAQSTTLVNEGNRKQTLMSSAWSIESMSRMTEDDS